MIVLELAQGHYGRIPEGSLKERVIRNLESADRTFLTNNPQCAPYHRPSWRLVTVPDHMTAPWGHEWYQVLDDGRLTMHSAQYDSSG